MSRSPVSPALPLTCLLLLALGACRQGPARSSAPTPENRSLPTTTAEVLQTTDPRMLRFHRVDMLIAQWDVAQASGQAEQAEQLFQQTGREVDGGLGDFVAGSTGTFGLRMQYIAVGGLGFSSRPEAARALVEQLSGRDPDLVGNALIALKLRADPDTPIPPLLKLAQANATAPRRYAPLAIANVLDARYRTGRGLDTETQRATAHVLSGLVADRDPFVRLHVAKALGALRGPGTYELLSILPRDEELRNRLAAAAGLERLGDPRGFPEAIRLLYDAPDDMKPVVRDLLVSYGGTLQGGMLSAADVDRLGISATAWSRWFADLAQARGFALEEGRHTGAPPGVAHSRLPGSAPSSTLPPDGTFPPTAPPATWTPPAR